MIRHTGEKPFVCTWPGCGTAFCEKMGLERHHKRFHTAVRPYVCSVASCGAAYITEYLVRDHISSRHGGSGSVRFVPGHVPANGGGVDRKRRRESVGNAGSVKAGCPSDVGGVTSEVGVMQNKAGRYVCPRLLCGATFLSKKTMRGHMGLHSTGRRFACTWGGCGYRSRWQSAIYNHMRHVHGAKPFVCRVPGCGREFAYCKLFTAHEKSHGSGSGSGRGGGSGSGRGDGNGSGSESGTGTGTGTGSGDRSGSVDGRGSSDSSDDIVIADLRSGGGGDAAPEAVDDSASSVFRSVQAQYDIVQTFFFLHQIELVSVPCTLLQVTSVMHLDTCSPFSVLVMILSITDSPSTQPSRLHIHMLAVSGRAAFGNALFCGTSCLLLPCFSY
jgi:hypothetical protein